MQEGLYKFTVHNTIGYYRDYSGQIKVEPAEAEIVKYIYVYYVSDYPFADGNRFPAFLKSVRFFFHHHQIVLRHVMNQEGHFLTREEYAQIKR